MCLRQLASSRVDSFRFRGMSSKNFAYHLRARLFSAFIFDINVAAGDNSRAHYILPVSSRRTHIRTYVHTIQIHRKTLASRAGITHSAYTKDALVPPFFPITYPSCRAAAWIALARIRHVYFHRGASAKTKRRDS